MRSFKSMGSLALLTGLFLAAAAWAQDRERMRDSDRNWDTQNKRYTQLVPGTLISVRPNESIDVERKDNRVYTGIVDRNVRGSNGQMAIPRGSTVELIVRVAADNDLILDLESVTVNGQRYAVKTDANHVESARDNSLVGAIVGAISGGQARGRAVRIPRDTLLTFRIERPLDMGVSDSGETHDGKHYHDSDRNERNQ
jgi:hypothetical protein